MLSVIYKPFMLSLILLSVVLQNVVAPLVSHQKTTKLKVHFKVLKNNRQRQLKYKQPGDDVIKLFCP